MPFSDRQIAAMKPQATPYRVSEGGADPGFQVQVLPSGTIVWQLQYRWLGKVRYLKLGTYPSTSLSDARKRCREARAKIEAGTDPASSQNAATCEKLFDWYERQMIASGRRTAAQVRHGLRVEAEPIIGHLSPVEVAPDHISIILRNIIERGSAPRSNRVRAHLRRAFALGLKADHDPARPRGERFNLLSNPVDAVPKQLGVEAPGERVLSWDELKAVWHWPCSEYFRLALRYLLLTCGQRSAEVLGARHDEFRSDLWEIPASRTKNKRPHVIPVHPLAAEIVERLRAEHGSACPWLWPANWDRRAKRTVPSTSLSHVARRTNLPEGYLKSHGVEVMAPWTPRDLRRTVKTRMGELGISKEIRDRLQNHSLTDVSSKHYDRYDYLTEKREAVWAWCIQLETLNK